MADRSLESADRVHRRLHRGLADADATPPDDPAPVDLHVPHPADKPERELVEKRREYAEARIPEYWIVNPFTETITVLVLDDNPSAAVYAEYGDFGRGERAASRLLDGFGIDVDAVFDAE